MHWLPPFLGANQRPPQVRRLVGPGAGSACCSTEVSHHPEPSSGLATLHPACAERAALLHPLAELLCAFLPDHSVVDWGRGSLSSAYELPLRDAPRFPLFSLPLWALFYVPACSNTGILGPMLAPVSAPGPFTSTLCGVARGRAPLPLSLGWSL